MFQVLRTPEGWIILKDGKKWGPKTFLPQAGSPEYDEIKKALDVKPEEEHQLAQLLLKTKLTAEKPPPPTTIEVRRYEVGEYEISVINEDYTSIHPAIGVTNDVAYIGVWIPCEVRKKVKKAKGEGGEEKEKTKISDLLFLVTSNKELLLANDEELRKKKWRLSYVPVKLPGKWPLSSVRKYLSGSSKVDPVGLLSKIVKAWQEYLEFDDPREYALFALWDLGTYFHTLFSAYPYLYIGGAKRTGKTKALTLHSCLAFNAFFSNNMSSSSIYRLIQNARGTLLIDETEKLSNPDRALEFRSILLSGYKRGAMVYRVEKTKKEVLVPEAFEVYAPKALANIRGLEDVLEDRCIVTILKRGRDRHIVNREVQPEDEIWSELRSELHQLFLDHWHEVMCVYNRISELSEPSELVNIVRINRNSEDLKVLSARSWELWKPLIVLAIFFDDKMRAQGLSAEHVLSTKFTCSPSSLSSPSKNRSPSSPSSPNSLTSLIVDLALEKVRASMVEDMTETGEVLLINALLSLVKEDGYYRVRGIADAMRSYFDEEQAWLTTRWVGNALRRLGFQEKRRVGTGYEYRLTVDSVKDLAVRFGIEIPEEEIQKQKSNESQETTDVDRDKIGRKEESRAISESSEKSSREDFRIVRLSQEDMFKGECGLCSSLDLIAGFLNGVPACGRCLTREENKEKLQHKCGECRWFKALRCERRPELVVASSERPACELFEVKEG